MANSRLHCVSLNTRGESWRHQVGRTVGPIEYDKRCEDPNEDAQGLRCVTRPLVNARTMIVFVSTMLGKISRTVGE